MYQRLRLISTPLIALSQPPEHSLLDYSKRVYVRSVYLTNNVQHGTLLLRHPEQLLPLFHYLAG